MIDTSKDILWILDGVANICTNKQVKSIIVKAIDEISGIDNLPALSEAEKEMIREGRNISAMKSYKYRTGCSLITAKRTVERYTE